MGNKYDKQPTARTADRRELMNSAGLDFGESDRRKTSDTAENIRRPRGKAPMKDREPDAEEVMLKSALDKQANLLALAADAARHNGDSALAQTLYMESADAAMDKLRLDVSSLKTSSGRKSDNRGGKSGGLKKDDRTVTRYPTVLAILPSALGRHVYHRCTPSLSSSRCRGRVTG